VKRLALATAILAIVVAILVFLTIQPARLILPNPSPDQSIPGAFHIHTNRSDGQSAIDDIVTAAAPD
jgi:hypothetical protein